MNKYVAVFTSHYDALIFCNEMKKGGIAATLAPAPRKVSTSCGTCVLFESDSINNLPNCDVEAIYINIDGKYSIVLVN
ncbi:MAG: DUF3343 domain-containing protein [Defluviitaleaceae bacterium]|nr:DUF3343 domain-containing protein [Defluviitaleaceae bacterium]